MGSSRAFSPIQGMNGRVGNTEGARYSTSLKYRVNLGRFRAAALWQFGGYGQNNAANGAYQLQAGGDIPTSGKGVLSIDATVSKIALWHIAAQGWRGLMSAAGRSRHKPAGRQFGL